MFLLEVCFNKIWLYLQPRIYLGQTPTSRSYFSFLLHVQFCYLFGISFNWSSPHVFILSSFTVCSRVPFNWLSDYLTVCPNLAFQSAIRQQHTLWFRSWVFPSGWFFHICVEYFYISSDTNSVWERTITLLLQGYFVHLLSNSTTLPWYLHQLARRLYTLAAVIYCYTTLHTSRRPGTAYSLLNFILKSILKWVSIGANYILLFSVNNKVSYLL